MATIAEVLLWDTGALAGAADDLTTQRHDLLDLQDELDAARPPSGWVDAAGDSARTVHDGLYARVADLVAEVSKVVGSLDALQSDFVAAQEDLREAVQSARGQGLTVDTATGMVRDPATYDDPEDARASGYRVQAAAYAISTALQAANDADTALVEALDAAQQGAVDGGTGTLAAAGAQVPTRIGVDDVEGIDFSTLSDQQLAEVLADNPALVDDLMALDDPSEAQQRAVRDLLVPRVDGGDAEDDLTALDAARDDDGDADAFRVAFEDSGTMAEYAAWREQHGGPPLTDAQVDYLRTFTHGVQDDFGDVTDFIDDDGRYTDAEREDLQRGLADNLLMLSNTDLGGSWDDLPEDVRDAAGQEGYMSSHSRMEGLQSGTEYQWYDNGDFNDLTELLSRSDLQPGTGLSHELARTAAETLDNRAAFDGTYEGLYDEKTDGGFEDAASARALDLAGRNPHAVQDLVTGEGLDDYDARDFLRTIYGHEWSDDGEVAAGFTDWLHEANTDDATPEQRAHHDAVFNALADQLTSTGDDGIFKDLMGDDESATQVNPFLNRSLIEATSDHLDEFGAQPETEGAGPLSSADRVRLLTLMASDDSHRDFLAATVQAQQADNVNGWAGTDPDDRAPLRDLADRNARLSTYLDSALFNEAYERDLNADEAAQSRADALTNGLGLVGAVGGLVPGGGYVGAGTSILGMLVDADNSPTPAASVDPTWSPNGDHVVIANSAQLVAALDETGEVDLSGLDPDVRAVIEDPSGRSDAEIRAAYDDVLGTVLDDRNDGYGQFSGEISGSYDADLNYWSVLGDDDEHVEEFLESEDWGTEAR